MGLTKREVDAATYDGDGNTRDVRWDDRVTGFGLRVYPSGRKSYVIQYRTPSGRTRLMTLGAHGVLTVEQARKRARVELAKVAEGRDPLEERRREERAVKTFRQLADRWLEDYSKAHRKSWPEDERRLKKHILPRLGRIGVEDVTAADVRALHAKIGKRAPVEANRVVNLVRTIYNKGVKWGLVPEGHANPASSVERYQERSRERWLTAAELKQLSKALAAEEDIYAVAAIRLLLLTGSRKTELLRARWDRLDLEGRRLLLEDTKTGEPKVTPLSAPALEVIQSLPRMLHSPWIFPSPRDPKEPRADIRNAWRRVRDAAKIPDATIHDLRRTTGSWLVQRGVPLKVVGAALGHRDTRATEVYARIAAEQPAEALEMLGEAFGDLGAAEGGDA